MRCVINMNINEYVNRIINPDPAEKPLDNIIENGGFMSVFRTVAVIGDSLASGEFESTDVSGTKRGYHDMYEYSWGQYIADKAGCKVYNFSRGGMTAKEFMRSYGSSRSFFDVSKAAQAYIIALGVNDVINHKQPVGTVDDLWDGNPDSDSTFCGYYNALILRYKEIQPDAKFFLMTMPSKESGGAKENEAVREEHSRVLYEFAEKYKNTYVLDLHKYMPVNGEDYRKAFYLGGHLNPMGYLLTATVTVSYIDYIIRHNMEDFMQVPFIGKGTHNHTAKW